MLYRLRCFECAYEHYNKNYKDQILQYTVIRTKSPVLEINCVSCLHESTETITTSIFLIAVWKQQIKFSIREDTRYERLVDKLQSAHSTGMSISGGSKPKFPY